MRMAESEKIYQSCSWAKVACFGLCWFVITSFTQCQYVLQAGEVLRDWESLTSSNGFFNLMFLSTDLSSNIYLGIQYRYTETRVVWVANRDNPLSDHSGVLSLTSNGTLMINSTSSPPIVLYAGQQGLSVAGNINLTLLETGNLVLTAGEEVIWQSIDHPTDTWLPDMKVGMFGLRSGQPWQQSLVSWLTPSIATPGAFTLGVDPNNTKQLVISQRGSVIWQSGVWNGTGFSHLPPNLFYIDLDWEKTIVAAAIAFNYVSNENESYFTFPFAPGVGRNYISKAFITVNSSGALDIYALSNGNAESISDRYSCPNSTKSDWSMGCAFKPSNCPNGDKFVLSTKFKGVFDESNAADNLNFYDCKEICRKNCACVAYSSYNKDGTGCLFSYDPWVGQLGSSYNAIYVRQKKKEIPISVIIFVPIIFFVLLILGLLFYFSRRDSGLGGYVRNALSAAYDKIWDLRHPESRLEQDSDLPLFSFFDMKYATRNFSIENKLGQGGFGPVYKGKLENGQEIAVKRLSRNSGQGIKEFKNEVILISKLQHRNLVRLIGCCIQREEKLLVYEYMPNKSLDSFIFDPTKRILLDWGKRFCIIQGIAQGLLYLHKYSRLRIIQRDLKTSNILLDCDLNPKISDFGTARIFGDNEIRANTCRIVGTYGYMSPEYAMDGLFSEKSDVFSYGVMMLEIISGKKNTGFYHHDRFVNLLGYAWELWKEGMGLELMHPELNVTSSMNEVMRCIQIGLLCVQEGAEDRPSMLEVVSLLSHEIITVPTPKQPAFFLNTSASEEQPSEDSERFSVNKVTISDVNGR